MQSVVEPLATFVPAGVHGAPEWGRRIEAMSRRLEARWRQPDPAAPDPDVFALQVACTEVRLAFERALELHASP